MTQTHEHIAGPWDPLPEGYYVVGRGNRYELHYAPEKSFVRSAPQAFLPRTLHKWFTEAADEHNSHLYKLTRLKAEAAHCHGFGNAALGAVTMREMVEALNGLLMMIQYDRLIPDSVSYMQAAINVSVKLEAGMPGGTEATP